VAESASVQSGSVVPDHPAEKVVDLGQRHARDVDPLQVRDLEDLAPGAQWVLLVLPLRARVRREDLE
jgi:hypothetical protein